MSASVRTTGMLASLRLTHGPLVEITEDSGKAMAQYLGVSTDEVAGELLKAQRDGLLAIAPDFGSLSINLSQDEARITVEQLGLTKS